MTLEMAMMLGCGVSSVNLLPLWTSLTVIAVQFNTGSSLQMLSIGEVVIIDSSDSISLECEFFAADHEDFNLFDNPVLWHKSQFTEAMQMNMMGNLMEPFASEQRFQVSYTPDASRHLMTLSIVNATREDCGNYSCVVYGPHNTLLASVVYNLHIRVPVSKTVIVSSGGGDSIRFVEHEPGHVRCISHSGCLVPSLTIRLGQRDITDQFTRTMSVTMTGRRGLRLIDYVSLLESADVYARPTDDGQYLICIVTLTGLPSVRVQSKVTVNYGPIINCTQSAAATGDGNAFLRCEIQSRPEVSTLYWVVDVNRTTTVKDGDSTATAFWTLVRIVSENLLESELYLRNVQDDSFRTYTIVAENSIGARSKPVRLVQKDSESSTPKFSGRQTLGLANSGNGTTHSMSAADDGRPRHVITPDVTSGAATALPSLYDYVATIITRQYTQLLASASIAARMLERLSTVDDEVGDD